MKRRNFLAAGCAQCALLALHGAHAAESWTAPDRFQRPAADSDEAGLWAMMERQEVRLKRSSFLLTDEPLSRYLQTLACNLGGAHCPDIRTYAVRTPWFNAAMAPNGMMEVWSGLLLRCDNESQLAAIIGHEIGHYLERHSLQLLRNAKSTSALGQFLVAFGGVAGLAATIPLLAGAYAFSRDQERDADRIGLHLMRNAGYDPREASKIWANLLQELSSGEGDDPTKKSVLFASHPPSDERRKTLAELASQMSADALRPRSEEYDLLLGNVMPMLLGDELKRGRYDETICLLDRKLAQSAVRSDFLYFRGEALRLRNKPGDTERAIGDFSAAARLGNEPPETHRSLGFIFQRQQSPDQAYGEFARYLELAPKASDRGMVESYLKEIRP